MGQTKFLGKYPIHFHVFIIVCLFTERITGQWQKILGTTWLAIAPTSRIAWKGDNTISFNLGGIHTPPGWGWLRWWANDGRYQQMLQHPFYITNVHNRIIGNAASGVWNGFAFLSSKPPLGAHKGVNLRLSSRFSLEIDGNTAPKGTMQQDFILKGRYILPILNLQCW